jgi:hypothetical protein
MLDVSIEAGNHVLGSKSQVSASNQKIDLAGEVELKVTHQFLQGQSSFFFPETLQITLLDTPDHFDYDSACTMILNLRLTAVVAVVERLFCRIDPVAEGCA